MSGTTEHERTCSIVVDSWLYSRIHSGYSTAFLNIRQLAIRDETMTILGLTSSISFSAASTISAMDGISGTCALQYDVCCELCGRCAGGGVWWVALGACQKERTTYAHKHKHTHSYYL